MMQPWHSPYSRYSAFVPCKVVEHILNVFFVRRVNRSKPSKFRIPIRISGCDCGTDFVERSLACIEPQFRPCPSPSEHLDDVLSPTLGIVWIDNSNAPQKGILSNPLSKKSRHEQVCFRKPVSNDIYFTGVLDRVNRAAPLFTNQFMRRDFSQCWRNDQRRSVGGLDTDDAEIICLAASHWTQRCVTFPPVTIDKNAANPILEPINRSVELNHFDRTRMILDRNSLLQRCVPSERPRASLQIWLSGSLGCEHGCALVSWKATPLKSALSTNSSLKKHVIIRREYDWSLRQLGIPQNRHAHQMSSEVDMRGWKFRRRSIDVPDYARNGLTYGSLFIGKSSASDWLRQFPKVGLREKLFNVVPITVKYARNGSAFIAKFKEHFVVPLQSFRRTALHLVSSIHESVHQWSSGTNRTARTKQIDTSAGCMVPKAPSFRNRNARFHRELRIQGLHNASNLHSGRLCA